MWVESIVCNISVVFWGQSVVVVVVIVAEDNCKVFTSNRRQYLLA